MEPQVHRKIPEQGAWSGRLLRHLGVFGTLVVFFGSFASGSLGSVVAEGSLSFGPLESGGSAGAERGGGATGWIVQLRGVLRGMDEVFWTKGFWTLGRPEQPGSLGVSFGGGLAGAGGTESLVGRDVFFGESLWLEQGFPGLERFRAKLCRGGACQPAKVIQRSSVEFSVELGAGTILLRDYGDLCLGGEGPCQMMIPSWALTSLAQSGEGILRVPRVIVVAQGPLGLIQLWDGDRRPGGTQSGMESYRPWLELRGDRDGLVEGLGELTGAMMAGEGRLLLRWERGFLLMDFVEDLALLGDVKGSLWLSESGIGAGQFGEFHQVSMGGRVSGPGLELGDRFWITARKIVVFDVGFNRSFRLEETLEGLRDWQRGRLMVGGGGAFMESVGRDGVSTYEKLRVESRAGGLRRALGLSKTSGQQPGGFLKATLEEVVISGEKASVEDLPRSFLTKGDGGVGEMEAEVGSAMWEEMVQDVGSHRLFWGTQPDGGGNSGGDLGAKSSVKSAEEARLSGVSQGPGGTVLGYRWQREGRFLWKICRPAQDPVR